MQTVLFELTSINQMKSTLFYNVKRKKCFDAANYSVLAPYYTPKEQAVLAFAEVLTHMPAEQHSEAIHDELSEYFSKEEIANLTMAVIQINSWNRLTRSFGSVPGKYKVSDQKVPAAVVYQPAFKSRYIDE